MDLRQATNFILAAHDVASWVKMADSYIQAYNRMPSRFVLPAEHAVLQPIIEAFATDVGAFSDYIRAVRDASGDAFDELHALYRTISVRALQLVRRARLRKAALLLQPELETLIGKKIVYDDMMRVARRLEQAWGGSRMDAMSDGRAALKSKRLSSEDRSLLLDAFWKQIDIELESGNVPLGDKVMPIIIGELKNENTPLVLQWTDSFRDVSQEVLPH